MKTSIYISLLVFLFASCGNSTKQVDNRTVFRYNEAGGITSLDPAFCRNLENIWAVNMLYNGLVQLDNELRIQPCLAKEWRISSDGKRYQFTLNSDITFHSDKAFKHGTRNLLASDVVYSFERIIDPKTASPGAWVFANLQGDSLASHRGIVALNDSVVEIHLKEAFPAFLSILAMQYCSIVPKEAVEKYGNDFGRHPVGTGPFKFFMWEDGLKLVLHKNQDYFENDENGKPLPYLDAVAVSFLKDKNANFLAMLKGDFDFLSGLDASYKDELLTPQGLLNPNFESKFYLQKQAFLKTDYLGFMVDSTKEIAKNHPILNKQVRQALNLAIDRDELIRFLRNNVGIAANAGFVPDALIEQKRALTLKYDLNKAAALLAKAGYPKGQNMPVLSIATTAGGAEICEYVQNQWQKLGVKVKVEVMPEANHREGVANGTVLIFRKSWIADYPDAQNFLSVFESKGFAPAGPNYTHFSNANFDAKYQQAMTTIDLKERAQAYEQLDKIIANEAPVVPLYYDEVVRLVNKKVSGLPANALNLLELKRVKMTSK